jgi:hypothetical protein
MKGGKRIGAGRKSVAMEQQTSELCKQAIISTYGGNIEAMKSLLDSGEVPLIKFVFEHAFGKPTEKIESIADNQAPTITTLTNEQLALVFAKYDK